MMQRWREAYQNIATIQQQDISSWPFEGRLKFLAVFRHTLIKLQNTYNTQLAAFTVFKCLYPNLMKIGNKSFVIY